MVSSTSHMAIILLWYLCATTLYLSLCNGNLDIRCNIKDREGLQIFERSIEDPSKLLSSWSSGDDCCKWHGVQCHNVTGRVTKLDLKCSYNDTKCLGGQINFSVLQLEFLSHLNLQGNAFKAIHIPPIHGSANSQVSHNMSLFTTHHHESNFSNLLFLDLSHNYDLYMDNLGWVSQLSSLKYLNLSGIDLSKETLWLQWITMLPSLLELQLSGCSLSSIQPSFGYVNFTSLELLDISNNNFGLEVPRWLFNLRSSISYLNLSYNNLNGSIPKWMGQYKQLEYLDLSFNLFCGPIPETFGNLSSLAFLDIRSNRLNGSLPKSLGQLSNLQRLSVSHNSLSGILFKHSFTKLSKLKSLELDSSVFTFDVSSQWHPPFQLEYVSMSFCNLGPEFPSWLYTQRSLSHLDISSSGLSFNAHDKFWKFVAQIIHLNLSNNSISGEISYLINNVYIDLRSNNFKGKLPNLSPRVGVFSISNNKFSGSIYPLLCQTMNGNQVLAVLDMSNNLLSGDLPDCWMHWQSLIHLNLGSNKLTGEIPNSIGALINLGTLRFHNNSLSGKLPPSLQNCKKLWILDLGFNKISGNIPTLIGHLPMVLLLRSNNFSGSISPQICQLSNLQVLDLAYNNLSGLIPKCLSNITSMVVTNIVRSFNIPPLYIDTMEFLLETILKDLPLFVKGRESNNWKDIRLLRVIDLSSNDLSGSIPPELFSLVALQSLNLSHNHLMGNIPGDIVHMKLLESLDLSRNQFVGEIPQNMSDLSFLDYLNLSYNNLHGSIPLGTQLQSFDASCYMGNPGLCGAPLTKNCSLGEIPIEKKQIEGGNDEFTTWFYIGMGVGFAFGFWVVCGTLFFIRTWRHAYFRFLNNMNDRIYVFIALKKNWFH